MIAGATYSVYPEMLEEQAVREVEERPWGGDSRTGDAEEKMRREAPWSEKKIPLIETETAGESGGREDTERRRTKTFLRWWCREFFRDGNRMTKYRRECELVGRPEPQGISVSHYRNAATCPLRLSAIQEFVITFWPAPTASASNGCRFGLCLLFHHGSGGK